MTSQVRAVARAIRTVIPVSLFREDAVVAHYSIPALDALGGPRLEDPADIDSDKLAVEPGDVLISKLNPRKSRVQIVSAHDVRAIASTEFVVLRPDRAVPEYLAYLLSSDASRQALAARVQSVTRSQQRADAGDVLRLPLPTTDISEQRAIAVALDRDLAEVDVLISRATALLDRVSEWEASRRLELLTGRGMAGGKRVTGIDWMGDIPASWTVQRMRTLTPVKRGASPRPIDDPVYFDADGSHGWVRIADVTASGKYLNATTQRLSVLGRARSISLEPGELILSIAASVGKVVITDIQCCIHDGFVYFPKANQHPHLVEWLYHLLKCSDVFGGLGKLGTQLNLNTDTVASIAVPLPPVEERADIIEQLDALEANVLAVTSLARRLLARLAEFREFVIQDAVHPVLVGSRVANSAHERDVRGRLPHHQVAVT